MTKMKYGIQGAIIQNWQQNIRRLFAHTSSLQELGGLEKEICGIVHITASEALETISSKTKAPLDGASSVSQSQGEGN